MQASNRMLTAVDLTATGVIINKHFLKVTYSPFNYHNIHYSEQLSHSPLCVCVEDESAFVTFEIVV